MGPENLCYLTNSQVMLTLLVQTLGTRGLKSAGVSRDRWGGKGVPGCLDSHSARAAEAQSGEPR